MILTKAIKPQKNKFRFFLLTAVTVLILISSCEKRDFVKVMKVTTDAASNITPTTATVSGNIIDIGSGITAYGHCWAQSPAPIVDYLSKTQKGSRSSTGGFSSSLTGLSSGTKYYVRAYAANSTGTAYGNIISFKTPWPFGTITDVRDGKTYKTVKIGNQWWMAKNLNIGKHVQSINTGEFHFDMFDNDTIEKYCYDNNEAYCDTFGGLYEWHEMMQYDNIEGIQGICPNDWHIPTDEEWKILEMELGMSQEEANNTGFRGTDQGTQLKIGGTSGFDVLLAGVRGSNSGNLLKIGSSGYFWSSTKLTGGRRLTLSSSQVNRDHYFTPNGFSVRCIKD